MNWELITRDKQGEIHVSFLWIIMLITFVGFLFGLGFSIAYVIVDSLYTGDGFYLHYMLKEYNVVFAIAVVFFMVYSLKKQERSDKK